MTLAHEEHLVMFQYPLADRRACGGRIRLKMRYYSSFSILLRIVELAATVYSREDSRQSVSVSSCGS